MKFDALDRKNYLFFVNTRNMCRRHGMALGLGEGAFNYFETLPVRTRLYYVVKTILYIYIALLCNTIYKSILTCFEFRPSNYKSSS